MQPSGDNGGNTMLFHTFSSQDERRQFGGSDFIELQYCRIRQGAEIGEILSVQAIEHWKNDSLYIFGEDMDAFFAQYCKIFSNGIYNNRECGVVDLLGINYYSPEQTALMTEAIKKETPADSQRLLDWLDGGKQYNGFYVLGV